MTTYKSPARSRAQESTARTTTDSVARCRRCHRPLHSNLAVAAGLGPVCAMSAIARRPLRDGPAVDARQLLLPLDGGPGE